MYVRASHVCLVLIEVRRGHLSWAVVAHAFNPTTWEPRKEKTKTKTTPSAPKKKWASVLEQELFIWLMSCSVSVGHELWVFCNSSQCS